MLAISITAQPIPICHVITSPKNRTPHNVPNIGTEYVTLDEAVGPKILIPENIIGMRDLYKKLLKSPRNIIPLKETPETHLT